MASEAMASVFMSGRSQAVRIPKAFRVDAERMTIRRRGESLVLTPVKKVDQWAAQREAIEMAKNDADLVLAMPKRDEWEGYPRMGFGEPAGHFEGRVRKYEENRKRAERDWRAQHD